MVFVSVSETYDLSTKAGKMSLIGIHTPSRDIIQKTYPGLCMNSKFVRIAKQDVVVACASVQPFSAEIIGTGADDIAPEDAFNPILYKAVSNDSMSNIEARLAGLQFSGSANQITGESAIVNNANVTGLADEFKVYYSLLSNRDGFKTANPQEGLVLTNLVPLVFEKYYNVGVNAGLEQDTLGTYPVDATGANGVHVRTTHTPHAMRGKAHPMPKFNTTYVTSIASGTSSPNVRVANGMGNGSPQNSQSLMPEIMPVYTACIIMPPSRSHSLFYRMVVKTTLEFTEIRPIQEIASFATLDADYAPSVYYSDYVAQSKQMTATAGMVDAQNAEIEKIMEGR